MTSKRSPEEENTPVDLVDIFAILPPALRMNQAISQDIGRHLILYDGVCGLCNRFNAFVLPRDRHGLFQFAPIQSEIGRLKLLQFGHNPEALDTFYVVADYRTATPRVLTRAHAALFVARQLGGVFRFAAILGVLPDPLLNSVYNFIARHRYRIFGRYETCLMPMAEYKSRFVG
jgi:predicted DCC family thiol-disulfide oxidoreductase YuxK